MMKPIFLNVFLMQNDLKIQVGELAQKNKDIYFEYDADFLLKKIELSPFKLPLKPGILQDKERVFSGLPGVFYDSLPDGWGLLLMDRYFRSKGIDPFTCSPLERLAYLGDRAMGALSYEPASSIQYQWKKGLDLQKLAQDCQIILQGHEDDILPELIIAGGSPGGARPKVLVGICEKEHAVISGVEKIPENYRHYLVKFSELTDDSDAAQVEYAYSMMARDCGITITPTRLLPMNKHGCAFAMERFDRQHNQRIHMHSLCGLLHANFRIPNIDYTDFINATWMLTKNINDAKQAFRRMVFNIVFHNRDDHSKNHAYLYKDNQWVLSPAYDLTFSTGIAGEHTMTIAGAGANPEMAHVLAVAESTNISKKEALMIIEQVKNVRDHWSEYAEEAQVSSKVSERMLKAFQQIQI